MIATVLALALVASPSPSRPSLAAEAGFALMEPSGHMALEGALPLGALRGLVRVEWNPWISIQTSLRSNRGVFNAGVGAELRYFDDRMSSSLHLGVSVLLFRSAFDAPGTFGPYLGIVPATFRFSLGGSRALRLTPLSFHLLAPSLQSIPLISFQYRHSLSFELGF